jgi:hypothetical protein
LQYPQFANISQSLVQGDILTTAEQFCRNDGGGPVYIFSLQTTLLNLMVAHICALFYPSGSSAGPSGIVGRIDSATEGSVSVHAEMPVGNNPDVAWYQQTPYGSAFYKLMPKLGRYYPRLRQLPQPGLNPWPGGLAR